LRSGHRKQVSVSVAKVLGEESAVAAIGARTTCSGKIWVTNAHESVLVEHKCEDTESESESGPDDGDVYVDANEEGEKGN